MMMMTVKMCSEEAEMFSTSAIAFLIGSYCGLNSTRARLSSTSALVGAIASALRKHSIECRASPFIRQKLPIWLYSCTDRGFSAFALRSRRSSASMSKFFSDFGPFFLRKRNATSGSGTTGWLYRWATPIRSS
uniref:Uncharacterized protein n=1 Tax=Anopheles melas TaxID=34690 RepID=A0A182TGN6_9DIPT